MPSKRCHKKTSIEPESVRPLAEMAGALLADGMHDCAVNVMKGKIWQLATDPAGTRVVQIALQQMSREKVLSVLRELHGHVLEACWCFNANYTLQRAIEVSPASGIDFVMLSLIGHEIQVACHRVGCRILCRILEHNATQPTACSIVSNLLDNAPKLICHRYGNYVMTSFLEHGSDIHRHILAMVFLGPQFIEDHVLGKKGQWAQGVADAVLLHCAPSDKRELFAKLMVHEAVLVKTPAGRFLLKSLQRCSSQMFGEVDKG